MIARAANQTFGELFTLKLIAILREGYGWDRAPGRSGGWADSCNSCAPLDLEKSSPHTTEFHHLSVLLGSASGSRRYGLRPGAIGRLRQRGC